MWTRIVSLSTGLAVALYGVTLLAEQPPCSPPASSLWTSTPWLRLQVVAGRLSVTSTRCGSYRVSSEPATASATRQSLHIQMQPGTMTAHYELCSRQSELALSVEEQGRLTIARRGRGEPATAEIAYDQPAKGPITLSIGTQPPKKYAAASLWHLLLTEPEVAHEHLLPLLAQLRPDWALDEQVGQIEAALVARAGDDVVPLRHQWQNWVEQLASESFAERQAADRALRAGGQPVVGFLREHDTRGLGPEQRRRIAGILAATATADADSPDRVADWLLADKRVWLSLMSRGQLDQRIAAAQHLTRLCGRSLAFNPEGDAQQRQAQLAALSAKLAEN